MENAASGSGVHPDRGIPSWRRQSDGSERRDTRSKTGLGTIEISSEHSAVLDTCQRISNAKSAWRRQWGESRQVDGKRSLLTYGNSTDRCSLAPLCLPAAWVIIRRKIPAGLTKHGTPPFHPPSPPVRDLYLRGESHPG